jgi:hypothetical protein
MTKYIVVVNWQSKKLGELHSNMVIEAKNEVDAFEIAIRKIKKHKRYLKWIETSLVCEQLLK